MTRLTLWKAPTLLLVLLAIAGFCLANNRAPLMLVAWTVAGAGWWHSERPGGRGLPRWAVLTLVLGVILWAAFRANSQQIDVTVFCEFLTLVLMVKTWDRKRARDIAQLVAMSIFLIIGAVLDNNNLAVGLVLLICMPLSAWAVMMLQLGSGREHVAAAAAQAHAAAAEMQHRPPLPPTTAPGRVGRLTARRLLPLAGLATVFGFGIALLVFLIVPRGIAAGQWGSLGAPSRTIRTGFTEDVELGRAGLLTESQRTVLEASFSDGDNNRLGGEGQVFYLRGAVMNFYQDGRWNPTGLPGSQEKTVLEPTRDRTIVQEIDLRESSGDRQPLFALWKNTLVRTDQESIVATGAGQIWYREHGKKGPLRYRVNSVDQAAPPDVVERGEEVSFPSKVVHDYAVEVLTRAGMNPDPQTRPPSEDPAVARILTGHLRGKFEYTTVIGSPPDRQDPIEWFLTTEKMGHCEYFASALTALCQSVGINARVVTGYIATEFDDQRGVYTVRESNAHAWTEVEVAAGIWITLDATPPVALMAVHESRPSLATRIARLMDALNDTWTNSVVMFDRQQQYQLFDLGRLRMPWIDGLSRQAAEDYRQSRGKSVFKYILVTAAILFAVAGLSVAAFKAMSDLGRRLGRAGPAGQAPLDPQMRQLLEHTGFYAQALDLLKKAGLPKPPQITPLVHARSLAASDPLAGEAFAEITSLFYSVRFGRAALSQSQAHRAAQLVDELGRALALRATSAAARPAGPAVSKPSR